MTDKRIHLDEKDLERLKALMKKAETKVDKLADEDLAKQEELLERRLRRIGPKKQGATDFTMERGLKSAQKAVRDEAFQKEQSDLALNAPAAPTARLYAWFGAAAVAAVALFSITPLFEPPGQDRLSENFTFKGTVGTEPSQCHIDLFSRSGQPVSPSTDGLGFIGARGDFLQLTLRCNQDGYLAVAEDRKIVLRNVAIKQDDKIQILNEGEPFGIIVGDKTVNLELAFSPSPLPGDVTDLQSSLPSTFLWLDSYTVKGRDL